METILALGLFLIGLNFWIWIGFAAVVFGATILNYSQHTIISFISILGFILIVCFLNNVPVGEYIVNNPLHILAYALGYTILGVTWSFINWTLFLRKIKNIKNEYLKSGSDIKYITSHLKYKINYEGLSYPPKAGEFASRIISSIIYWPLSIVWYFTSDFLVEFTTMMFNHLRNVYQNISDKILSN